MAPLRQHLYRNIDGSLYGRKEKYGPQQYGWFRWQDGKFISGLAGKAPIYHADQVALSATIVLTEGERDADTLAQFKFCTSCGPNGASWDDEWADNFKGKTVIICPDRDEQGAKYALRAGVSLLGIAAEVKLIELPEGFSGHKIKDITDVFEATGDQFGDIWQTLLDSARPFVDFQEAGKNGDTPHQQKSVLEMLDEVEFDETKLHTKPVAVFTLKGQVISTPGNITTIYALPKAGKSAVISCLISCAISNKGGDYLGWAASPNPSSKALVHFDTEQSRYDHEQIVIRALKRGDCAKPSWVHSYCVTGFDIKIRMEALKEELKRRNQQHGGIFAVLIDGIGDYIPDVNDPKTSTELVNELQALAIEYSCVIVVVLHENPGDKNAKNAGRGHLGSHLSRKSESNIRLAKADGIISQYTEVSRHASIPKIDGHTFTWDEENYTHASCEQTNSERRPRSKKDESTSIIEVFDGFERDGIGHDDLARLVQSKCHCASFDAAKKKVSRWFNNKLIHRSSVTGKYYPGEK